MKRAAALTVGLLVLVPACGSDDEVTDIAGIPVLEGHTSGPGTELGDGFSVVEGSTLLGDVLPPRMQYGPDPPEQHGWRALLLVPGDPAEVVAAYARQAAAAGFTVDSPPDRMCWNSGTRFICGVYANEGPLGHARHFAVGLERRPAEDDQPPSSHLSLAFWTTGAAGQVAPPPKPCECLISARSPELPEGWPPLADVGDTFEASIPNQEAMVVESGSRLVAPMGTTEGLWSAALFEVTGDPEEVLDRYEHQNEPYDQFSRRDRVDGGTRLHRFWGHGGGIYTADVLVRRGRPTYLLLEHSATD